MVDRCGRKYSLLLAAVPYLVGSILLGLAQSYWWFLAARFIAGLGSGISYTVAPMYLGEIADDRIRGALGSLINFMLTAGILLTYSVGPWIGRVALADFGAAFPIIFGLMFFWMPESPHYLALIIVLGLVLAQQFSGMGAILAYSSLIYM